MVYDNKYKGAIFCKVINITHWIHLKPFITWGNQKWKGAAPNLISKAVDIKIKDFVDSVNIMAPKIMKAEPMAWTKKYFKAASVAYWLFFIEIHGINDIRFNSKPHHAPNQESDEIDKITPPIKVEKNKQALGEINTKKREVRILINGVWTHQLILAYLFKNI